jgi:inner membrane protein
MDSLTHIALGACMGDAFCGRQLGKKAMLWGAMAQSIPDIDFLAAFWMDTADNLLAHRGITHSLFFCILLTPLLAYMAERLHRPHNISFSKWMLFFGGVIFIHIFLDAFNNYGVGWFEPFYNKRISFNTIYVADPFFSFFPALALVFLLIINRHNRSMRKKWWLIGMGFPAVYLLYALVNKTNINRDFQHTLKEKNIVYSRYFTTPAPLQNWLWYTVAGTDSGYYVGFRSVFDTSGHEEMQYFPRNANMLDTILDHHDVQQLIRFSQEFYTVEKWHDTLVFNDLRFGQIIGWYDPRQKFVFHYYLSHPKDNKLVVQRGRFEGWNELVAKALWRKIVGGETRQ